MRVPIPQLQLTLASQTKALVGEHTHRPSSRAHLFTARIFFSFNVQRSTLSLPSSSQIRLCTLILYHAMRAFLVATLVLVASVITPALSAPLRYAGVPFKLERKIID